VIEPVRKSVHVAVPPADAFRVFTDRLADWWPLATHSAYEEDAASVAFADGRLVEVSRAGEENVWGEVTAWEPPARVAFTWNPNLEKDGFTEVEVRFTPNGAGTHVELEHRAWDALGERGQATRDRYHDGWVFVLDRYAVGADA
jgi:uncharacterized protein YndB with AHSA1/START domain